MISPPPALSRPERCSSAFSHRTFTHGLIRRNRLALGVLALVLPCALQAQSAELSAADAPVVLDAVTVTAPLNEVLEVNVGAFGARDPLDIPLSIQSYDARTISETSARTAMDVLAVDPSVSGASLGSSFDSFRLRGFKIDNFSSIRRDGMTVLPYHDEGLENIERMDVLKGPSGFLYGFNSPGGTVNYILKRPTQEPFLRLTTQGSSLNGRYLAVDTSDVVAEGLFGWRLNAAYEKVGNFNHAGDMERKFASLATDFRLGERAVLQLNADWYRKSVVSDPLLRADQSGRANPLDPSSYILPPRVDRRDLLAPSWWRYNTEVANFDAKLEYRLAPDWVSVTQLAYSHLDGGEIFTDYFDIQPNGDIGYADLYAFREEKFSNRAVQSHLSGKFYTGSVHHDLFMGAASREMRGNTPQADFIDSTSTPVGSISVGNILNPVQPPKLSFGPRHPVAFRMNIQERSLFASDLISLTDQFQVLLGGRYIWYRAKDLQQGVPPQRKNVFVPAGALMVRPTDNLMTYVSYTRGFEAGEYAPIYANNANQPTDAIESEQVEIGLKADINASLNVGVALFDIKRDASYLNSANDFVSNGRFVHRGIEVNATARLSRNLTLTGNAAYLDTELKDVADTTTLGKRSEGVPRWKGALGARYAFAGVPGLSADTLLSYVGTRPVDAQNSGFVPGYLLWDAGINYQTKLGGTQTTFRLHAKNLTNKYYYASVYYLGGLQVGRGREIFLSAQMAF